MESKMRMEVFFGLRKKKSESIGAISFPEKQKNGNIEWIPYTIHPLTERTVVFRHPQKQFAVMDGRKYHDGYTIMIDYMNGYMRLRIFNGEYSEEMDFDNEIDFTVDDAWFD